MRQPFRASLITLALIASIDTAAAQSSQQEKLNLNSTKEHAVTQGLADQPAHSVPGFSGQVGSKLPASETAQQLPSGVQAQVPETKGMLFVKLPDRILLIDPDSQAVAEIIMNPVTTGSGSTPPAGSSSAPALSPAR
ncbi:MAG: hypothetical protein QOF09_4721 [Alphaproteobacteria bacterium]|jgi:hypothetical protein|nr:hypothetical protein [Alphaproteobacteria bacterium]